MSFNLPTKGFIFWPVGTGDSTTVRISEDVYLQVDIRHMNKAENDEDAAWPIIDHLEEVLPDVDGRPYLSTFALTHPDMDHCQGFADLLERIHIGEIWLSPRTFREYQNNENLCEDAEAFHDEALRRVEATIAAGGDPGSGNRVRIIGYDHWLQEEPYKGLPNQYLSIPGHTITQIDSVDYEGIFSAFVHAPFLDDSYGDRNDCSLAFQITLTEGSGKASALLLGDLKYPILRRIFTISDEENLQWNVLLAPHHCSKSAMYWKEEGDEAEKLKQDILDAMANTALTPGYVISSSTPVPATNQDGDNPPHAKAKQQYLRIVPNSFLCTHEHPNKKSPIPIAFEVTVAGLSYMGDTAESSSLEESVNTAQGSSDTPATAVGFGRAIK